MNADALVERIAARYAALPQVEAVALAGSRTNDDADGDSDLDLYVYTRDEVPIEARAAIAHEAGLHAEVDNRFWEPADEWVDAETGAGVDVMYRATGWIEEQLNRVLVRHAASLGCSTCFWHNVRTSRALFDRDGWFRGLQRRAEQPYPEPLRRAIVAKNHPILCAHISSYRRQIELAQRRDDPVSVNHRVAALLASYFDILFAVNRLPHPGTKRLLRLAIARCPLVPDNMHEDVRNLVRAAGADEDTLLSRVDALVDGLDALLRGEGLL